jgi:uncharacterized protein (DUF1697 family)
MTRAIAFLRAINVGGRTVRMETLRRLCSDLGLGCVETFIASGNVIFETKARNLRRLEATIAQALAATLGYDVATFIRTTDELAAVAAGTPFDAALVEACPTFCVGFVGRPLDSGARRRLRALETDSDRFHVSGTHVYWLSRMKQSDATFSNLIFERTAGQPATFRGMNTIRRMAARYAASAGGRA